LLTGQSLKAWAIAQGVHTDYLHSLSSIRAGLATRDSEPRVNLGGGPPHVINRLYSVLKNGCTKAFRERSETTRFKRKPRPHGYANRQAVRSGVRKAGLTVHIREYCRSHDQQHASATCPALACCWSWLCFAHALKIGAKLAR
jgi:hypothetical protein